MAEVYVKQLLDPFSGMNPTTCPDEYLRRSSVFRLNGNVSLTSSAANGHLLFRAEPQMASSSSQFFTAWTDGVNPLYVLNLPVIANLTATVSNGQNMTTYFQFSRMVAFQLKFRYIGAELTQAGELSIGFDNVNMVVVGNNVKSMIQDSQFCVRGDAASEFIATWIPQDDTDFQFHTPSTWPKSQYWGTIHGAGTGYPLGIPVYDVEWAAIIEGLVIPANQDFIPRSISPYGNRSSCLRLLHGMVLNDPTLLYRNKALANCMHSVSSQSTETLVIPKFEKFANPTFPTSDKSWTDGILKDYPPDYLGRKVWKAFYP